MIAIRRVVVLTLWFVALSGLPHLAGAVQAQDALEKEQSNSEKPSEPQSTQPEAKLTDGSQQDLVARLEKYLTGTKWTGNFIMDGKEELIQEHYEILSAKKSEFGDNWNLIARIKYGGHDTTLPLPPIEIKFAGKTPVITVDKAVFPGLGTFDARVVIRQGKYAGTWKHGKKGGFLFGTIQSMSEKELEATKKAVQKITEE